MEFAERPERRGPKSLDERQWPSWRVSGIARFPTIPVSVSASVASAVAAYAGLHVGSGHQSGSSICSREYGRSVGMVRSHSRLAVL